MHLLPLSCIVGMLYWGIFFKNPIDKALLNNNYLLKLKYVLLGVGNYLKSIKMMKNVVLYIY